MENNMNINNEMEQLKEQLAIFKKKLDTQTIVTDKMLRESTHSKIMWMRNLNRYISIAGLFVLPIVYGILKFAGVPTEAIMVIVIMMIAEAVWNFVTTRGMKTLAAGELLKVKERMLRFKRSEKRQMMIEVPLIIAWLIWVGITANTEFAISFIIGGIIGLVIAFVLFAKEMRYIEEINKQIEEVGKDFEE